MPIPRSVNRLVNWLQVLPRLGVTPRTSVLPSVTDCPLCGGDRLYMLQDTLFGGEWHHCRSCHSTGDMISLAARHWKIDIADAITRLVEDRDDGPEMHAGYVASQARGDAMVRAARAADTGRLKPVLQKLFLTVPSSRDRWTGRLGRFAGVTHKSDVERGFSAAERGAAWGCNKVFAGRGWGDVLVVPFHDLPGRLRAVWIYGNDGETVFRPLPGPGPETGLGFFDALPDGPDPDFGNTVFVVNDVPTALRLHDKNFQQSVRPLPLLASHAQGRYWARLDSYLLAGRKLVFWGPRTTRELLLQAKAGDGYVAGADDIREPLERHLARYTAKAWLRFVEGRAEHWTAALERHLAGLPDVEAAAVLDLMSLTTDERQRFDAAAGAATRERLRRMRSQSLPRRILFDDYDIMETNGHWYAVGRLPRHRDRRLITDAPFRIERVIQYPEQDRADYEVTATFDGTRISFSVPAREFERAPLEYVRTQVCRAGLGLASYSPAWGCRAVAVATQFWKPEFVRGAERCGWDEALNGWVFERFAISARGEVTTDRPVRPAGPLRPTAGLEPPADLHPDDVELLSRGDEAGKVVWAATAAIVANLVAPVVNQDTSGLALAGEGAVALGKAAALLLGCTEQRVFGADGGKRKGGERAAELERASGWPVVLHRVNNYNGYHVPAWLSLPGARNAVFDFDPVVSAGLAARGGWHAVECHRAFASGAEYRRALPLVAPAFLKWFAERGLSLDRAETFGESVLDALADWFAGAGGDPLAVSAARDVIRFDHGGRGVPAAARFGDLLCRLAAAGTPLPDYTEEGHVFVPAASLNKLLATRGAPVLATPDVTRALAEAGVLVGEADRGDPVESGWEVGREWWDDLYRRWRGAAARRTA